MTKAAGRERPQPAVGAPARGGGKGNHGRWVGDKFFSADEIVEQCRTLLASNWPAGDIKRALVKRFGGKGLSFGRHLSIARKRNLESIGRTAPEAKSDSIQFWRVLEAEQQQKRPGIEKEIAAAREKLAVLQQAFDLTTGGEALEVATLRLEQQTSVMVRAERRLAECLNAIERHQHTIDNLLGNKAPMQIEDVSEKRRELAHPTQPLTDRESQALLRAMLGKIRQVEEERARAAVVQEVATPSEN